MNNTTRNKRVYTMVSCALLIAIEVIFTRFLSIQTPFIRIGFGFVPVSISGIMFGPVYGLIVGGVSDLLGVTLFPAGLFHPGFTLTAALSGMVYGLLLHRKDSAPVWSNRQFCIRVAIAVMINGLVLSLGLNTVWLTQMYDKAYLVLFPPRVIKEVVMMCIEFSLISLVNVTLVKPIMRRQVQNARSV